MIHGSIGDYLKNERKTRALSLEQVANTTRIPRKTLVSLEEGRFDELPGDVFVRGFIKAYASAVDIQADPLVAQFDAGRPRIRQPAPLPREESRRGYSAVVLGVTTAMLFAIIVATFVMIRRPAAQAEPIELSSAQPCQVESVKPEHSFSARSTIVTPTELSLS